MEKLNFKYSTKTLEKILTDLGELTGASFSFRDENFNVIVNCIDPNDYCSVLQKQVSENKPCHFSDIEILKKCKKSRSLEQHICHAGLCDFAMPIIKNDIIVGYIIFGRIRTVKSPQKHSYYSGSENCNDLDILFNKLPYFTERQINCITDLLPRILFENAIQIEFDTLLNEITEFINSNLSCELNFSILCENFFVSKNKLYELFRTHYDTTVNGYITEQRIKKAKELLKSTDETVYKISTLVGINNYTYFCKLFKRKTGFTPLEYRKAST